MDLKEIEEAWRKPPYPSRVAMAGQIDWLISHIKELGGTQWERIANDLTEAKLENAKSLARVGELEDNQSYLKHPVIKAIQRTTINQAQTIRKLMADIKQAGARVKELEDYYARVINEPCPMDQKHCTCVPALRMRIDELEGAIRKHKDIDEWESVYGNRDEELYAHLKEREDER